jgi:hypothetical protein
MERLLDDGVKAILKKPRSIDEVINAMQPLAEVIVFAKWFVIKSEMLPRRRLFVILLHPMENVKPLE